MVTDMLYHVTVPQVYHTVVHVEAESREEAIYLVEIRLGAVLIDDKPRFHATMDSDEWIVTMSDSSKEE